MTIAEQLIAIGWQKGFEQGFKQGYREGYEQAQRELLERCGQYGIDLDSLNTPDAPASKKPH